MRTIRMKKTTFIIATVMAFIMAVLLVYRWREIRRLLAVCVCGNSRHDGGIDG